MPDGGTLSPTLPGTPNTYAVRPVDTTPVRLFGSRLGKCSEVIFQGLDDNSQTNKVAVGDSASSATATSAQSTTLGPGAVLIKNGIDPFDWYGASEGDSSHGISVEATK